MPEQITDAVLVLLVMAACTAVLSGLVKAVRKPEPSSRYDRYVPKNPEKYRGRIDSIDLKSKMEINFAGWCDRDPDVLQWSYEEIAIRYLAPGLFKVRRYYPDFEVIRRVDGGVEKSIVEIKPRYQTEPPANKGSLQSYINAVKTYKKNSAKWKAAERYARRKGWKFEVVTEDDPRTQAPRGR